MELVLAIAVVKLARKSWLVHLDSSQFFGWDVYLREVLGSLEDSKGRIL